MDQDKIILDNMQTVDFWAMNLGGDLQRNDRDELRGHLYLTLVQAVRESLTDEVVNVHGWLSVKVKFAAFDWLISLRKLPTTNHKFDVPEEFKKMPKADVVDLLDFACQNDKEKRVANLLMAGFSPSDIAIVTGAQPQRISDLKKRIFGRARRRINRLEKTQVLRPAPSRLSREVHGEG